MVRPKPKIRKDGSEWVLERPGFGFSKPETLRFPTRSAAVAKLKAIPRSQGGSFDRTVTPESTAWRKLEGFGPVIR